MAAPARLRIAVVGGGIAGIAAAYYLQQRHEVTIFEASGRLGGHAHAVAVEPGILADTAFLIFNQGSYPLFIRFLKDLGAYRAIHRVEMSFTFSDQNQDLHYALNRGLAGLQNWRNRDFRRLLGEILHYRKQAWRDLAAGRIGNQTLAQYLAGYSPLFRDSFIALMAAAVWSLPAELIWEFPAQTFVQFQMNHRLLKGPGYLLYSWHSFRRSSQQYINAFRDQFVGQVHLNRAVQSVRRFDDRVEIVSESGPAQTFDNVILATHAPLSLRLLEAPSPLEAQLLGAWRYHAKPVLLHTDAQVMHPSAKLWSSWNVSAQGQQTWITYYLNRVQALPTRQPYFLSLGDVPVRAEKVIGRFEYEHPVFDASSIATQARLPELNGRQHTYFCGSYFGFGFHEDALRSALAVVRHLEQS